MVTEEYFYVKCNRTERWRCVRSFSEMGLGRLALTANRSWELVAARVVLSVVFLLVPECWLREFSFGKLDLVWTRQKLDFTSLHQICMYTFSDKRKYLAISPCSVSQSFEKFLC